MQSLGQSDRFSSHVSQVPWHQPGHGIHNVASQIFRILEFSFTLNPVHFRADEHGSDPTALQAKEEEP